MLKKLALAAIGLYQRYLSPRKGFSCAYRVHANGVGCSGFGKHAIQKHGLLLGLVLLRRRFAKCAWHAEANQKAQYQPVARSNTTYPYNPNMARFTRQGGFADCGDCSGCDAPDLKGCDMPKLGCGRLFDVFDACGSCSSPGSSRHSSGSSCSTPSCCSSSSSADRERKRREQARRRREARNRKESDSDFDGFDGGGDGD